MPKSVKEKTPKPKPYAKKKEAAKVLISSFFDLAPKTTTSPFDENSDNENSDNETTTTTSKTKQMSPFSRSSGKREIVLPKPIITPPKSSPKKKASGSSGKKKSASKKQEEEEEEQSENDSDIMDSQQQHQQQDDTTMESQNLMDKFIGEGNDETTNNTTTTTTTTSTPKKSVTPKKSATPKKTTTTPKKTTTTTPKKPMAKKTAAKKKPEPPKVKKESSYVLMDDTDTDTDSDNYSDDSSDDYQDERDVSDHSDSEPTKSSSSKSTPRPSTRRSGPAPEITMDAFLFKKEDNSEEEYEDDFHDSEEDEKKKKKKRTPSKKVGSLSNLSSNSKKIPIKRSAKVLAPQKPLTSVHQLSIALHDDVAVNKKEEIPNTQQPTIQPGYEIDKIPLQGIFYDSTVPIVTENIETKEPFVYFNEHSKANFKFLTTAQSKSYIPNDGGQKSCKFKFSRSSQSHQLSPFESIDNPIPKKSKDTITFCGGHISSMAWCPLPFDRKSFNQSQCQYLAVAAHKDSKSTHLKRAVYKGDNIIQIYEYNITGGKIAKPIKDGNEEEDDDDDDDDKEEEEVTTKEEEVNQNDGDKKSKTTDNPRLVFSIAYNGNCIWDLKWIPIGGYVEDEITGKCIRLGVLAAVLGDGTVKVWSVPHPDYVNDQFARENTKATPLSKMIRIEPIFDQSLNFNVSNGFASMPSIDEKDFYGTTLAWSSCNDKIQPWLIVGCSNGLVLIFDIKLSTTNNNNQFLNPIFNHNQRQEVLNIAVNPLDRNLFIVNYQRSICVWDRRNQAQPQKNHIKDFESKSVLKWPENSNLPACLVTENALVKVMSLMHWASFSLSMHCSDVMDFDISGDHRLVASCSTNGSLTAYHFFLDKRKYKSKHKISFIYQYENLSYLITDKKEKEEGEEVEEEKILSFLSSPRTMQDFERQAPQTGNKSMFQYKAVEDVSFPDPKQMITKIAWNKNKPYFDCFVYGTNQGFIRFIQTNQ